LDDFQDAGSDIHPQRAESADQCGLAESLVRELGDKLGLSRHGPATPKRAAFPGNKIRHFFREKEVAAFHPSDPTGTGQRSVQPFRPLNSEKRIGGGLKVAWITDRLGISWKSPARRHQLLPSDLGKRSAGLGQVSAGLAGACWPANGLANGGAGDGASGGWGAAGGGVFGF
jgi:hypothetical protein